MKCMLNLIADGLPFKNYQFQIQSLSPFCNAHIFYPKITKIDSQFTIQVYKSSSQDDCVLQLVNFLRRMSRHAMEMEKETNKTATMTKTTNPLSENICGR